MPPGPASYDLRPPNGAGKVAVFENRIADLLLDQWARRPGHRRGPSVGVRRERCLQSRSATPSSRVRHPCMSLRGSSGFSVRGAGRRRSQGAQLTLDQARVPSGWGGWRPGAGRPRGRRSVPHARRERFAARFPQHVTLRVVAGVESLRRHRSMRVVRGAILDGGNRDHFRVIEFSVQSNHLHLIVEADGAAGLTVGMIGLEVRLARRLNRLLGRRGRLFAGRYHARSLRTPSEVRLALRYVLLNHRHHAEALTESPGGSSGTAALDPCSSGLWFDGWACRAPPREVWKRELLSRPRPTARATVWLMTTGWRRLGLLGLDELPGPAPRSARPRGSPPEPGSTAATSVRPGRSGCPRGR